METVLCIFIIMASTAAAPQYRPISPLVQRTSLSSLAPLSARTSINPLAPVSSVGALAPLVPSTVVKTSSPLKVAGIREDPTSAIILRFENDNNGIDGYSYAFETSDGQFKEEQGQLINPGIPEVESIAVRGQYSYIAPDGVLYTVTYTADENGFQPHAEQVARTL